MRSLVRWSHADCHSPRCQPYQCGGLLNATDVDYRTLYDEAPDMHLSVSANGLVRKCNQTLLERLGYTREQVVGQPLLGLPPRLPRPGPGQPAELS